MKKFLTPVFAAIIGLALALALLPAPDVQAQPVDQFEVRTAAITGTLVVTPNASVQLVASGFNASDRIEFLYNNSRLVLVSSANPTSTATGALTVTAKIPNRLPFGSYAFKAINQSGVYGTYTAQITPALQTNVAGASAGQPFSVNGWGFAASQAYTITWETTSTGTTGTVLGTGITSKYGTLALNTEVPEDATAGTYYVRGTSDGGPGWVTAVGP
jgi:hypothetical protein